MTLWDVIISARDPITVCHSQELEGSKTALIIGRQVVLSPAMITLFTDKTATINERQHLLRNIPVKPIHGTKEVVSE